MGEVVSSMISAFVEDTPIYLEKLKTAESNIDQIREMAHTIKDAVASFGAYELVQLSKNLEEQATSAAFVDVDIQIDKIYAAFELSQGGS